MSLLSAIFGVGVGLALAGGRWAGRGVALALLVVGGAAAWGGAWAALGPAIGLAALLGRREEGPLEVSPGLAPLGLVAFTCAAAAWSLASGAGAPSPPAAAASLEALRGEVWLGLGAAALLALAALGEERR